MANSPDNTLSQYSSSHGQSSLAANHAHAVQEENKRLHEVVKALEQKLEQETLQTTKYLDFIVDLETKLQEQKLYKAAAHEEIDEMAKEDRRTWHAAAWSQQTLDLAVVTVKRLQEDKGQLQEKLRIEKSANARLFNLSERLDNQLDARDKVDLENSREMRADRARINELENEVNDLRKDLTRAKLDLDDNREMHADHARINELEKEVNDLHKDLARAKLDKDHLAAAASRSTRTFSAMVTEARDVNRGLSMQNRKLRAQLGTTTLQHCGAECWCPNDRDDDGATDATDADTTEADETKGESGKATDGDKTDRNSAGSSRWTGIDKDDTDWSSAHTVEWTGSDEDYDGEDMDGYAGEVMDGYDADRDSVHHSELAETGQDDSGEDHDAGMDSMITHPGGTSREQPEYRSKPWSGSNQHDTLMDTLVGSFPGGCRLPKSLL
ncbi:hypothetical protein MBLNU459_g3329t1 [Dothideomycetes sp. NU459]